MLVLAVSGVLITPGIAADPSALAETVKHVREAMSDKLSWSQATMCSGSFRPPTDATRPEQLSVFF